MNAKVYSKTKTQRGYTLVEMMIALILGLVVVSAVVNMYVGSSRSAKFTRGLQTMQENGRYGVSVLQRGFRLAGYSPDLRIDPVDLTQSSNSSITVVMRSGFDCNGIDTALSPTAGYAENTYAHDAANSTITCQGSGPGATAMPIVEGVETFRVLYGLDTDDDAVPDSYEGYRADIPPRQIVGVRFAILVNSGTPIRTRNLSERFVVLDAVVDRDDRFARHVFGSTVLLRNRL